MTNVNKQLSKLRKEVGDLEKYTSKYYPNKYCFKYINRLSGIQFERYTAELLNKIGVPAVQTKGSEDFGVDVLGCLKRQNKKIKLGVQCKLYKCNEPVPYRAVEEITSGTSYYHLDKGIVLTNSKFTWNALKGANRNHISMWDRNDLKILMMLANNNIHITELNKMLYLMNNTY